MTMESPFPEYYREGMPGYVLRDWEVIDYECWQLGETGLWFRGPRPANLARGHYITAIGAAQTFGCFCPRPYPSILSERLGLEVVNLGYAGAGPAFFLKQPDVLRLVNESACCIIQVMSGRSTSNSLLQNPDGLGYGRRRSDGALITAESEFQHLLQREWDRIPLSGSRLQSLFLASTALPIPAVRKVVTESRRNWVRDYRALLQAITVPKVLFWFSKRAPFYVPRYHSRRALFGEFPQLVNASMIRAISPLADRYAACVSDRGSPQQLVSRFSGESTRIDLSKDWKRGSGRNGDYQSLYRGAWEANAYYPSPEMHEDAAAALGDVCAEFSSRVSPPIAAAPFGRQG